MKNGRDSNNNPKRRTDSSTTLAGQSIADGSDIRPNDRNQSAIDDRTIGSQIESKSIDANDPSEPRGNAQLKVADGFYFTPGGNIARIPDGHYIGGDGRLRKRRKQRSDGSNSSDGNTNRNYAETGESKINDTEIPIREIGNKRSGKAKKITEAQQRMTMIAMLSIACSATFTSIALLTKHNHWSLEPDEIKPLAEALNDAFATLPAKYYEQILAIIEKWVPWVNLVFVVSAIIIPRIEESVKRYETSRYATNNRSDSRNAGAENNTWTDETSVGFDVR